MLFDRTCIGGAMLPGLSHAWRVGGRLYGTLGRLDAYQGFTTWADGLDWLSTFRADQPIAEIQFWGHGKWGAARIDAEPLDVSALRPAHAHHARLQAIRERMTPDSTWWFRTCETFGAQPGHDFAQRWTDFFGNRAAGHTFVIGAWQSGLHGISAGHRPTWSLEEGLEAGTVERPERAYMSTRSAPNTIGCLRGEIPVAWIDELG